MRIPCPAPTARPRARLQAHALFRRDPFIRTRDLYYRLARDAELTDAI